LQSWSPAVSTVAPRHFSLSVPLSPRTASRPCSPSLPPTSTSLSSSLPKSLRPPVRRWLDRTLVLTMTDANHERAVQCDETRDLTSVALARVVGCCQDTNSTLLCHLEPIPIRPRLPIGQQSQQSRGPGEGANGSPLCLQVDA